MNAGQIMTWADFKLKFSKYHVPPGLIKKMRDEFRELKQGRMSVVEYRDRFLTLSRYAPDETDTTEKRKERFLNGLHDEMQTVLVNIRFADLEALVDSAIQMEGKLHQANENRKRRMMHQSGPSNTPRTGVEDTPGQEATTTTATTPTTTTPTSTAPRQEPPNNNNNNTNTAPRTGSNAIPVTPKDKSTITCYECGIVGHYSNECPKRLAKTAPNTTAPAQQQRRVSTGRKLTPNNPNNRNGRLFHMNAEEAQEAPDVVLYPPLVEERTTSTRHARAHDAQDHADDGMGAPTDTRSARVAPAARSTPGPPLSPSTSPRHHGYASHCLVPDPRPPSPETTTKPRHGHSVPRDRPTKFGTA
ncbi:hypothetical protein QYE76_000313 [Lolium multiflorum]|uniref:CCHC-type domain-containing protein n=1 Tax=Lolium multiflorum TaxID=4521 RepID=A0AAD8VY91_LOLMU|nr:hypothetical protein QYE76_000313 [Lolium multiflorum]